jgi:hypothetical protein
MKKQIAVLVIETDCDGDERTKELAFESIEETYKWWNENGHGFTDDGWYVDDFEFLN